MADISVTATAVVQGSNAKVASGRAGATITAGQMVYLDTTTNTYKLSDADSATAAVRSSIGMALNGASASQPITVQTGGDVTMNAVLTAGAAYYLSSTPGGIEPAADVSVGENILLIGLAKSTTVLSIKINEPGVISA